MAPSNKKNIIQALHVDDDLCFLEVSKHILSMENNFKIDNAASVDEAFKKLGQQSYDVVVCDYEMPHKNGLEFLKELREQNNQIPFILFTGKGREDVAVKALNLGADSYINKNGSPQTVYCELADAINKTVERKKSKKALAESELKYRIMVEKSFQGILITQTSPLRLVFANESIGNILGYSTEELKTLSPEEITKLIYHEDRTVFFKRLESRMLGEPAPSSLEFRAVRKNGSIVWLAAFANRIEYMGQPAVQGMFLDISERKKADQILKENEARYRELADSLPDIVFEIDLNGKLTFLNQRAFEITGYTREDFEKGLNIFQLATSEDIQRVLENMQKSLAGESLTPTEYTITRKNGTTFTGLIRASQRVSENKVIGLRAIIIDITERKKNDLEIKQKNEALERVTESIDAGLAVIGKDYSVVWANKRLKDLGVAPNKKCYQTFNHTQTICTNCGAKKIFEQNLPLDIHEFETINPKGETTWIELRVTPLKDKNGNVTAALELALPITERKQSERSLEESEEKYRKLFEESMDAIFVADTTTGIIVDCNTAASKLVGRQKSELVGQYQSIITPQEQMDGEFARVFKQHIKEQNSTLETQIVRKTGEIRDVAVRDTIFELKGKKLMQGTFRDITERKLMQNALQESEEKFRAIANSVRDAIILVNDEAKVVYWNPAAEITFGYSNVEAIDKEVHELIVPKTMCTEGRECIRINVKQFANSGSGSFTRGNVELLGQKKDGTEFPVKLSVTPIKLHGKWNAVGVVKDITERKQAEEKLRDTEKRYHTFFSQAPLGVLVIDPQTGKAVEFNDVAHTQLGYSREEFSKLRISDFEAKKTEDEIIAQTTRILTMGKDEFETKHRTKNGEIRDVLVTARAIELTGKSFLDCIFHDITEIRKMGNALIESEMKYRQLVNVAQEGIWALDNKNCTVFVNPRMAQMLGYTESELVGKNLRAFLDKPTQKKAKQFLAQYNDGVNERRNEYKLNRKNGSWIYTGIVASPLKDDNGNIVGTLALVSDITYRKALEGKVNDYSKHLKSMVDLRTAQLKDANERLIKSERLAAIGELAGMVGHDLRNPLAGIKNAAYYLRKKGTTISEAQAKETLEIINKAIDHSDKIINDLLDFSREIHLEPTKYAARTLVDEAIRMIQVPDRIQIVNSVHEKIWIWVDADKMIRVFINLIKNAIDAMPEKGILEISSCQRRDRVEIAFADTGVGIPEETLQKIFTPLFTTKAQGMGFGLAICKRVVESHEGKITVKTAVGKGTTFTITLPLKLNSQVPLEKR